MISGKGKAHELLTQKRDNRPVNQTNLPISWARRRRHKLHCPVNRPVVPGSTGPSPEQEVYVYVPFSLPRISLSEYGSSLETFFAGALYREFREVMQILTTFLGKKPQKSIIISTKGRNTRIMMDFCGFFQGKS